MKTGKTQQLAFRLEHALVAWLQAEAARFTAESPGMAFSVSDVARMILTRAMLESKDPPSKSAPVAAPKKTKAKADWR